VFKPVSQIRTVSPPYGREVGSAKLPHPPKEANPPWKGRLARGGRQVNMSPHRVGSPENGTVDKVYRVNPLVPEHVEPA
jgi:hypothetical protein